MAADIAPISREFTEDQLREIDEGRKAGINVVLYARPELLAIQMHEIRLALEAQLPIGKYANVDYDWFQLREIRLGLEHGVDVRKYAHPTVSFAVMKQIRRGLEEGIDLSKGRNFSAGVLRELRKATGSGVDLSEYIKKGYNEEQLREIRIAKENGLEIDAYVCRSHRGPSIHEIALGLEQHLDVTKYNDALYAWQQMREIRLGLAARVDTSKYCNALYSWQQMREIRLGLEESLPIERYSSFLYTAKEMRKRREELLESFTSIPNPGEREAVEGVYQDFTLLVSADGMEAYILVEEPGVRIKEDRLRAALALQNVVYGIDERKLTELERLGAESSMVVVAKGTLPTVGEDGFYEFLFDTDVKATPKLLPDGFVDYQNIKWFEMVRKGQPIVQYHGAMLGIPGRRVTGEEIPARRGRQMEPLTGRGFVVTPDGTTYAAGVDGKIDYCDGRLTITNVLVLDEVTQATGNVDFNGSVYVRGNVGDGTQIRAEREILVDGFVEGAYLTAGGDIILRKGANCAGKGHLMSKRDVMGQFFERAYVTAGRHIKANYCLNSECSAAGRIEIAGRKGMLAGGTIKAGTEISSFTIGNNAGIATRLIVGGLRDFVKEELALDKQREGVMHELELLHNAFSDFRRKYPPEVRNANPIYLKLEDAIYTKEKELSEIATAKEKLLKEKNRDEDRKVIVGGTLYPGVFIDISGARWIAEEVSGVVLRKKDGAIAIFKGRGL